MMLDLDGDGFDEWFVTVPLSSPTETEPCLECNPGEFWIVNGDGLVYQLSNSDSIYLVLPSVLTHADMTGDNLPEVVVTSEILGAHTTTTIYHIVSAHYGRIEDIIRRRNELDLISDFFRPVYGYESIDEVLFSSAEQEITDVTGDGLPDLILHGGAIGSIGAGLQRERTEIWAWDGKQITLANIQWEHTSWRIHTLFDAEFAFALGDYETAIARYESVIFDDALEDFESWTGGYTAQQSHDDTRQYAAFRLALTHLKLESVEKAIFWRHWLNAEYPNLPTAESVNLLLENWQESKNLTQACEVVTRFLRDYNGPTIFISTGYANPNLTSETLCSVN